MRHSPLGCHDFPAKDPRLLNGFRIKKDLQAALGIQIRIAEGLGERLVPFGGGLEFTPLVAHFGQYIEHIAALALGVIKLDTRNLGRLAHVFLIVGQAQRGVRQGTQTFRRLLHQGQSFEERQRILKGHACGFRIIAHTREDARQILQLGVAQLASHHHLIQHAPGHLRIRQVEFESLSRYGHTRGQHVGAGPGDSHCRINGSDGGQGFLETLPGLHKTVKTLQQIIHRLAGFPRHSIQRGAQLFRLRGGHVRSVGYARKLFVQGGGCLESLESFVG